MKKIIFLAGLMAMAGVADAINITLDLTPPKSPWELRRERTMEMHRALRVNEAKREAARYERRKRILNKAAEDLQRISTPSNAIQSITYDFKSGDVSVEYADGAKYLQRIQLPKKKLPRKSKSKVKEKNDV